MTSRLVVPERYSSLESRATGDIQGNVQYYPDYMERPSVPESFSDTLRQICEREGFEWRLDWNGWGRYWFISDKVEGAWKPLLRLLTPEDPPHPIPLDNRAVEFIAMRIMPDKKDEWKNRHIEDKKFRDALSKSVREKIAFHAADKGTQAWVDSGTSFERAERLARNAAIAVVSETFGDKEAALVEEDRKHTPTDKISVTVDKPFANLPPRRLRKKRKRRNSNGRSESSERTDNKSGGADG